jgi:hypothetical protein
VIGSWDSETCARMEASHKGASVVHFVEAQRHDADAGR